MPHKRAKHSARQSQRDSMGYDLPPRQSKAQKASFSDMPRHARVEVLAKLSSSQVANNSAASPSLTRLG